MGNVCKEATLERSRWAFFNGLLGSHATKGGGLWSRGMVLDGESEYGIRCPGDEAAMFGRAGSVRSSRRLAVVRVALTVLIGVQLLCPPARGETEGDIVLALDTSGSMQVNDPRKLRLEATRLFVSLLGGEARLALVTFDARAEVLVPLSPIPPDGGGEKRFVEDLMGIKSEGRFTNLYGALEISGGVLQSSKGPVRAIILMTDGQMDLGNVEQDLRFKERLLHGVLPGLARAGVQVFTLAFTRQSDIGLLKEVALKTGGSFCLIEQAEAIHAAMADIYGQVWSPDSLPIVGREFTVDGTVRELTLVLTRQDREAEHRLRTPSGAVISQAGRSNRIRWNRSSAYEMVTVTAPEEGTWTILGELSLQNRIFVLTDLRLVTRLGSHALQLDGKEQVVEAWLEERGQRILADSLGLSVRFLAQMDVPGGKSAERFPLFDDATHGDKVPSDGVYTGGFVARTLGQHRLKVFVQGETFQREKEHLFLVTEQPVPVLSLRPAAPAENIRSPAASPVQASAAKGGPLQEAGPVGETDLPEDDPYALSMEFFRLIVINLAAVVAVLCVYALLRRARKRFREAREETDD